MADFETVTASLAKLGMVWAFGYPGAASPDRQGCALVLKDVAALAACEGQPAEEARASIDLTLCLADQVCQKEAAAFRALKGSTDGAAAGATATNARDLRDARLRRFDPTVAEAEAEMHLDAERALRDAGVS